MLFECRDRKVLFDGRHHAVMGIINVTPDSFSDGGVNARTEDAVANALRMADDGALIIDVGGESTRPGADEVTEAEEISRVVPVIAGIREKSDIIISVDTYRSGTAEAALQAGADIINDITALRGDENMATVAKRHNAGVILMYNRRIDMNKSADVVRDCGAFLAHSIEIARKAEIRNENIMVDPGIGFGTTREEDMALIRHFRHVYPVLMALSRKRVADYLMGGDTVAGERDDLCLGMNLAAALLGSDIVRVHNVRQAVDAFRGFDAVLNYGLCDCGDGLTGEV